MTLESRTTTGEAEVNALMATVAKMAREKRIVDVFVRKRKWVKKRVWGW